MRVTIARTAVLALVCTSFATGCLFTVRHELPPNAYFGKFPSQPHEKIHRFKDHGMKNWFLAGLGPYTRWSSKDLLEKNGDGSHERIENLAIETRFGTLDTIIWVFPGFFYGYYVWAPRTVEVSGSQVIVDDR